MLWRVGDRVFDLSTNTMVMGVLNVTPDSFSDGGRFLDPEAALGHGLAMVAAGADIIDVGGESTRPGSDGLDQAVEIERVRPVIEQLARRTAALISIDTQKAAVAEVALEAGAQIINDVSALRSDPRMVEVARRTGASVILMHMLGRPRDMQRRPVYDDVTAQVRDFLAGAVARAVAAGLDPARLAVDPGIGFGKTFDHNLTLINRLEDFQDLGRPLVLGVSRKAFIGAVTGRETTRRTAGSLALAAVGVMKGAAVIRAHDVPETVDVVKMVRAVMRERT